MSNEPLEVRVGDLLNAWGTPDPYDRAKELLLYIREESDTGKRPRFDVGSGPFAGS